MSEKIKKHKELIIIIIIFIIGISLRIIYINNTPYYERQHDLGYLNSSGCLKYINTIFETGKLPTTNKFQFYHPPLHHIISALYLRVVSYFTIPNVANFESLQILTCFYSILLLFTVYKILKELKIKQIITIFILSIMSIHPTLIILSGSINNDMLSILLIHLVILYTIRWYKKNNLKNTILLAIITGAAVMTKTSGAIVAPGIAFIFIYKIIKDIKEKKKIIKKYSLLFIVFGIISLSIGLWYPIRNKILFNQPILYVLDPKDNNQYYGEVSLLDRFIPDINSIITSPYHNSYKSAHNIYAAAIKTSLFGEYEFATTGILYDLASTATIISFFIGIFIPIKIFIELIIKKELRWKIMLLIIIILNILSYLIMQIKLPYGCSSDFRYLVSTIFITLTLLGYIYQHNKNKIKKQSVIHIYTAILISLILADIVMFLNL